MAFFNMLTRWWGAGAKTQSLDMDLEYFTLVSSGTVIVTVRFVG